MGVKVRDCNWRGNSRDTAKDPMSTRSFSLILHIQRSQRTYSFLRSVPNSKTTPKIEKRQQKCNPQKYTSLSNPPFPTPLYAERQVRPSREEKNPTISPSYCPNQQAPSHDLAVTLQCRQKDISQNSPPGFSQREIYPLALPPSHRIVARNSSQRYSRCPTFVHFDRTRLPTAITWVALTTQERHEVSENSKHRARKKERRGEKTDVSISTRTMSSRQSASVFSSCLSSIHCGEGGDHMKRAETYLPP